VPRDLILASRSPRRLEALAALGLRFQALASQVEEDLPPASDPTDPVPVAAAKARDIAAGHPDAVVLAGDTIVVLGRDALGKPIDPADAEVMLRRLRGREHVVRTGLAICATGRCQTAEVACPLMMREYSDEDVRVYIATGEPLDCAGAYDVHRLGGALVAAVRGCLSTVVGFPIVQAAAMLQAVGIEVPRDPAQVCTELYGRLCLSLRPETAGACVALFTPPAASKVGSWRSRPPEA
jgi:septum formation protein